LSEKQNTVGKLTYSVSRHGKRGARGTRNKTNFKTIMQKENKEKKGEL